MLFILRFDLRNPAFAGVDMTDRYRAVLEMTEWADQRGALAVSFSEHHGSDDGYLPSPLVMAAAVAARTTNIAIAINALIAPFHDPLRLAEDIAVVDRLSGGRLNLTLAGGYVQEEFDMLGVPLSERPARLRETVATLRAAWTGEPFEFRGRTVQVTPTPAQPGGPKLVLGGSSEVAARRAARIGDGFVPSETHCWEFYRDECLKLGKPDPGPAMEFTADVVVLAEDPDAAWPVLGPYFMHESNAYGAWQVAAGHNAYRPFAELDELRADGQYRILTPDEYRAEMASAGDLAFGKLHPMVGGIPPELAWEHLHLFEETFLA
ncbi:MAG TPA: LLM class flavin-dependent oxidoreductase [Acidimicrobiales bacterium]|nr:LLM class flavin-dependent oxidoreductase [Acidimicrobiales bacterium]